MQNIPESEIIESTKQWLKDVVIGLNFCPFAKKEWVKSRIRFFVSLAETEENLLMDLASELEFIQSDASAENESSISTTLLIHPYVLTNFYDYNQFLSRADNLLQTLSLTGVYQIASFHPDYQFANTQPDAAENFTNRAPYPILHILSEESVAQAVDQYPNVDDIPQNNIERLTSLSEEDFKRYFPTLFQ